MLSRRLEMFVCTAEQGSFSKAAAALYLAPVSVKQQIDSLEAYVGTKLFVRTNQGVRLTEAGKVLYDEAKKIVFLANRALNRTREAASSQLQTVRVGTSPMRPCKPLTDLWKRIGRDQLPVNLQIVPFEDGDAQINALVESLGEDVDCFVAPCDSLRWLETCRVHVLGDLRLCIAMSAGHKLAGLDVLTWEDLDCETIMIPQSDDFPTVNALEQDIKDNHPAVHIAHTDAHTNETAFNRCANGNELMLSFEIWEDAHPALVTVPVDWDYNIPYGIIYAAKPSSAVEVLIRALEELGECEKRKEPAANHG